ncbi:MAG: hypothetical protein RIS38_1279, partial [Verrucomicrobiota bacterium]
QDFVFSAPVPVYEHPYLIPEGRDLGPENGFTFALLHKPKAACTFARLSAKPSAAGTRSRRPKAERPIPERPRPRWPSPVTRKCFPNRQPLTAVRLLLHLCTGRRPVALLHSGQHVVLSLPKAFTPPILHTQYSILSKSTFALHCAPRIPCIRILHRETSAISSSETGAGAKPRAAAIKAASAWA